MVRATKGKLPDDRNPLKADIVSRRPRADRMFVILGNRGVRPYRTLTILPHQSAARLRARPPLRPKHVFGLDCRSKDEYATWPCSIFAIDRKLRSCDVVALKVEDVAPNGYAIDRATVRQRKTGRPVKFELTEQTRQAIDDYLKTLGKKSGDFLFTGRRGDGQCLTTRQYARLVSEWIAKLFGTYSLRRTKATLIYRRTGNLRAVQLHLGHTKIESTVRYFGIEADDALSIAEQVDV
jgi:integrase-like protein